MPASKKRCWVPETCERLVQQVAAETSQSDSESLARHIYDLVERNRVIHEEETFNLDPASNVMNPRAEALLSARLGTRPSLGYPGDKYEMGLEAIEEIEIIAAELCAEIFDANYAEIRTPSGAIANLYAFMAVCRPGDKIIVPPTFIGGHVTHHEKGCAGLYGLQIREAPVNEEDFSYDIDALRQMARQERPALITIGGSLNLFPHPVRDIRAVADEVGALVLFDAAHQSGLIAGGQWPNPLAEGAHLMTMSTYKSLGGPPSGLIVTNDPELAQRLDHIAHPGMTANFDAAKSAALAITMLDWREYGRDYAREMVDLADAFVCALDREGLPIFETRRGKTESHQFAVLAEPFGGGHSAAKQLRLAGFLASGIGLPGPPVEGDMNGLRMGTPELVRWGVTKDDIGALASLIARALRHDHPQDLAAETARLRGKFQTLQYMLL